MVTLNLNDLAHILEQIRIAEAHTAAIADGQDPRTALAELVTNPLVPYGLRTVTGELNNFQIGMVTSGSADQLMQRLLTPVWQQAEANARTGASTSYAQTTGSVYDSQPRTISNLVSDQTLGNFAAISAALTINGVTGAENLNQTVAIWDVYKTALGTAAASPTEADHLRAIADPAVVEVLATHGIQLDGINVALGNVAADLGDTAPYNSFFTIFGQFFDHGLDLTNKGGNGSVYIPLQPDDPLYDPTSPTNFMVLTRATNQPGPDGILGTADDIRENANKTTPWIDLNQLYTSGPSHQVFLREYVMIDGKPMATGKMLEGAAGGPPTWADVKAQAREMLGIELSDLNVHGVPAVLTDLYGNFVPAANGMPQFVMADGSIQTGNVNARVDGAMAASTGHAFLDDIAHTAVPGTYVVNRLTGETALKTADADAITGNAIRPNAFGQNETYDNELLDRHFIVGDGRGNENIALTAIHTIFHSEHNNQVDAIKTTLLAGSDVALLNEYLLRDLPVNTDLASLTTEQKDALVWDGARLFQASRFTTEQVYQHLVFEEFVRSIAPQIDPFVFSNTAEIPVGISQEFAQVVYRFGHSMLNETVDMFGYQNNELGLTKETLFDVFLNPVAFEAQGVDAHAAAGAILRGMTRQHGNEIDEFLTDALRNNLVGLPLDLGALNMARARDTGIPSLNEARAQFFAQTGNTYVKPYESWTDFAANIKNPVSVINFIAAYGTHPTILAATTMEEKRAAACALIFADPSAPSDRLDYLNGTGTWAGVETGLNEVDFWIGGLAEAKMAFGGMLGSTFTFVFEAQMEMLQNNDRFYYLSRSQGMNLLTQLESDSFADLIQRNTDGEHLGLSINGAAFQTAAWVIEMDQSKQWNAGIGSADPTRDVDVLASMLGHDKLVERRDLDGDGDTDYIKYLGGEHVVIGGTAERDIIVSGAGDDGLWGYAGDDDIEGGFGVDHIHGGEGSDLITDMGTDVGAADVLKGEGGDDLINGGMGLDLIFGGSGRDVLAGGDEAKDVFAGQDDDFVRAASGGGGIYYGNEGNDWLEGQGNMNTLTGDNSELFFNSRVIGHDVMLAGENDTDFDAESGDDIMTAGTGVNRFNGMAGFDWVTHKGSVNPVDADMNIGIFANQQNLILRDRFDMVEGLSGWTGDDKLTGREQVGGGAAIVSPTSPIESFSNALLEQNVDMVDGLRELVSHLQTFTITQANTGETKLARMATDSNQDILLGGGGADIIKGMGGDDIIDGDKWLNIRIELLDDAKSAFATSDGLTKQIVSLVTGTVTYLGQQIEAVAGEVLFGGKTLEGALFARQVKAADLNVVREILDGDLNDTDIDTAVYWDIRANYTLVRNADGSFSITHDNNAPGPIDPTTGRTLGNEGTDRLTNIERLEFADGEIFIKNVAATGAPVISDTTPTENQTLTADPDNIVDLNGFGPDPMQFQWQSSTDGGTTWTDIAGATDATYRPGQAQVGQLLRVEVSFVDGMGYTETLVSDATAAVVDSNVAPTGALTISDTTPQSGQTLFASSLNIRDANGFNPVTTQQSFQWQSSADGVTWTDIAGATGVSFQPGAGQLGLQLRATVTFTDGEGTVESVTSAATRAVGNTINGTASAETLTGTAGDDVISGLRGNDTINAGAGDDTINWNANLVFTATDGRDVVDGGAGIDTIQIVTRALAGETYRIYTREAAIAAGITPANANTEIIITRDGTTTASSILHLDNIEEIVITGPLGGTVGVTAPTNGAPTGGTANGDTVIVIGDFSTTSLALNTITINGSDQDDLVDITALDSAHRIVFRTAGGNDVVVGTLRPQDVIEVPQGADPAAYVATDNGDGTVTMATDTHSVTFTGAIDALPTLAPEGSYQHGDGGAEHAPQDDDGETPETEAEGSEEEGAGDGSAEAGDGNGSSSETCSDDGADDDSQTGGTTPAPAPVRGVVAMADGTVCETEGNAGDDVLIGTAGGDALMGDAGNDLLLGEEGNDVLMGGAGSDTIDGGAGRDVVMGGDGDDLIIARSGDGADMIFGGAGSDTLDLSSMSEGATIDLGAYTAIGTVRTGGVTDHLIGVENVIGSTGADVIKAGLGVNVMTGEDGDDIFVFVSAAVADGDIITDFRPGDRIDLSGIDAVAGLNGNQSFTLAGQGTTAAGSLVISELVSEDSVDTLIQGFTDDDAEADFTITLRGAHNLDGSSFNF
ncbi:heme peroxidase [Rhodobacteraceae bacterium HSP-20]|uniref:Heme peroxidase n=1 Tax=Paragemmobacter amnigenus TaxID=2852097 RepID=A0ABS6J4T0_9RHOB|nr:peroxidase family protein [Rhodobacter amnigenus]MBU9698758.1 heme peroxidase [Rhodobacter amnigenus]MBV4389985.1 heme peroxidase [Rhodobacter amnigenus]